MLTSADASTGRDELDELRAEVRDLRLRLAAVEETAQPAPDDRPSRRDLLRRAGLAAAGGVGAALMLPRPAAAANGQAILVGDQGTQNTGTFATRLAAADNFANNSTVFTATAATAGGSTTSANGLSGIGLGIGDGVQAFGGAVGGDGVFAVGGAGSGSAVIASGGDPAGVGVNAVGGSSTLFAASVPFGVIGRGGPDAAGVLGIGGSGADGSGVEGRGGGGPGGTFTGGLNQIGVAASGANGFISGPGKLGIDASGGNGAGGSGGGAGIQTVGGTGSTTGTSGPGLLATGGSAANSGQLPGPGAQLVGGAGTANNVPGAAGATATGGNPNGSVVGGLGLLAVGGGSGTLRGAPLRLQPATNAGAPTVGARLAGEVWIDSAGTAWICIAGGSPGTWSRVGQIRPAFGAQANTGGVTNFLPRPIRIKDTRVPAGPKLNAGSTLDIAVTGTTIDGLSVPTGTVGVLGTVTVTQTEGAFGFLTLYPLGSPPNAGFETSNVNWSAPDQNVATAFACALSPAGHLIVHNGIVPGSNPTHVIVDIAAFVF